MKIYFLCNGNIIVDLDKLLFLYSHFIFNQTKKINIYFLSFFFSSSIPNTDGGKLKNFQSSHSSIKCNQFGLI